MRAPHGFLQSHPSAIYAAFHPLKLYSLHSKEMVTIWPGEKSFLDFIKQERKRQKLLPILLTLRHKKRMYSINGGIPLVQYDSKELYT